MGKRIWVITIAAVVIFSFFLYRHRDFFISNKGIYYFKKGNYVCAAQLLEVVAPLRPHHYNTAFYLSRALWKLGRYEEAEEILQRFVSANPQNIRAEKALAFLRFHRGYPDNAASRLNNILREYKTFSKFSEDERILVPALIDYVVGDYYAALKVLENPGELIRENEAALWGLRGICFYKIRLFDKAHKAFNTSLNLFRDNPFLLTHLSILNFLSDNKSDALYNYDRARSLNFKEATKIARSEMARLGQMASVDDFTSPTLSITPDKSEIATNYHPRALPQIPLDANGIKGVSESGEPVIAIFKNRRIRFELTVPISGQYKIIVIARGTPSSSIWPRAAVSINGILIRHLYIRCNRWEMYPVGVELLKGKNTLDIEYINDGERLTGGEDRNLFLRKVFISKEASAK